MTKKSKAAASPMARADGSRSSDEASDDVPDLRDAICRLQIQQEEDGNNISSLHREMSANTAQLDTNTAKLYDLAWPMTSPRRSKSDSRTMLPVRHPSTLRTNTPDFVLLSYILTNLRPKRSTCTCTTRRPSTWSTLTRYCSAFVVTASSSLLPAATVSTI